MDNFIDLLDQEYNKTETENGAEALRSTGNKCLDAFGTLGASMSADEDFIINAFKGAFFEDRDVAMRILFYMRDARGGQGIRRPFRIILKWLAENYPDYVTNNLENVLYFGRGDDYLCLLDTHLANRVMMFISDQLSKDLAAMRDNVPCSLLAKWLPSENASSAETKRYARQIISYFNHNFNCNARLYRKTLSSLRKYINVVEAKMSANRWDEIKYDMVPSKASLRYTNAFENHDGERYIKYIASLADGSGKVNANLFPVDIVHRILSSGNHKQSARQLHDAMWNALPDYFEGATETGICVVDTSGSMYGTPLEVAVSLGMYCADKCKGPFKGTFITFSEHPQIQHVIGADITDKVLALSRADWQMNTNIVAVFDGILQTAIRNGCAPNEIPAKVYIISDMQFDGMVDTSDMTVHGKTHDQETLMRRLAARFEAHGYRMPNIVYWNVRNSHKGMFQETHLGQNCCMVSGYSPSLFKAVIRGTEYEKETRIVNGEEKTVTVEKLDPMTVMNAAIYDERYDRVWTGYAEK